ncbi:hypothetical protein BGZ96_008579 [Linnemannia gamsii]|uniref:Uncharacterized protein n=1 Tax=Linnemannia gamsii TaxID=64522 RepID=A0ABQ7JYJ5_9FUNG|nr:hypothetical protein BGZ96_008579 [Linnemannia gamsii]
MAATSEQVFMPIDQDLKHSITTVAPASATKLTHNKTNSMSTSSIRSSSKERGSPFSITLPSSCSRSSQLNHSLVFNTLAGPDDDNDSTAGFEEALALQQQQESNEGGSNNHEVGLQPSDQPPVRRRSIQFVPGEDDSLTNHEGKQRGLPKTPYPVSEERDLLFNKH